MGLMDKAKQAAMQAKEQAQHMAQQGQAKVAEVQQGRQEGELYRALGEAYYNAQRRGGDQAAVSTALQALDSHFAGAAASDAGGAASGGAASGTGAAGAGGVGAAGAAGMAAPPPPSPAAPPPAGDFTLDDV
jgi:replicative DNA helicase